MLKSLETELIYSLSQLFKVFKVSFKSFSKALGVLKKCKTEFQFQEQFQLHLECELS